MKLNTVEKIFEALNENKIRYLVAGGLAVVAHGYLRFTADIDFLLDMDRKNLKAAIRVFEALGYRPRAPVAMEEFADPGKREKWVRDKGLTVFSLWSPDHPATEIDLFVEEPLVFEDAYQRRVPLKVIEHVEATVIGLDDLIALKKRAGRAQDFDDIKKLNIISEETSLD